MQFNVGFIDDFDGSGGGAVHSIIIGLMHRSKTATHSIPMRGDAGSQYFVPSASWCNEVERCRLLYAYSNWKTRFQSSFMLTSIQLFCFAASSASSRYPKYDIRS